mmetsp:Transcript_27922/g.91373  ORF Transcript_27922/g.91373 Transcript_27922/m.91373 type:complete len:289 (-) Transcript_27922:1795-2661(-)
MSLFSSDARYTAMVNAGPAWEQEWHRVLRAYNQRAGVLHALQGILLLVASQVVSSIRDFRKDITTSYLVFDAAAQALVPRTETVGTVQIGLAAAVFLLMSAAAHAIVLWKWELYVADLRKGINRMRWYEYAVSSSLMICSIAVLFGCYDLGSLLLMFILNASMNFFGLLMERLNPLDASLGPPGASRRAAVQWEPFVFGCVAGAGSWIVILLYFFGGGNFADIPAFVYGILVSYFVFFNSFALNMYLQKARVGAWADYLFGESVYIWLSLSSKSLLAWLVFGGCFQPN